jgi:hypothetical protein
MIKMQLWLWNDWVYFKFIILMIILIFIFLLINILLKSNLFRDTMKSLRWFSKITSWMAVTITFKVTNIRTSNVFSFTALEPYIDSYMH